MSNIEDEQIQPVVIPYALLQRPDDTLPSLLQRAFSSSPTSLGLVLVSDLPPSFPTLRRRLLLMSNEFASLPAATRERYTDPASSYLYGWSHGKERMNGQLDVAKGSFYANPQWDETPPTVEGGLPGKNVWPAEVEGYEETFKALCALMINVGGLVAQACEAVVRNVAGREGLANRKTVEELILTSKANKARLLHYYPREGSSFVLPSLGADCQAEPPTTTRIDDSWCSEHIDHSILTVLCPAMYLFHPTAATAALDPLIIPSPSASTGLYIKTRAGKTIKATIPENCLALQTGETLELLSSGRLAATPHFVNSTASTLGQAAIEAIERKKASDERWRDVQSGTVSRETLAVFLQPNNDEVVSSAGETFGEFSERVTRPTRAGPTASPPTLGVADSLASNATAESRFLHPQYPARGTASPSAPSYARPAHRRASSAAAALQAVERPPAGSPALATPANPVRRQSYIKHPPRAPGRTVTDPFVPIGRQLGDDGMSSSSRRQAWSSPYPPIQEQPMNPYPPIVLPQSQSTPPLPYRDDDRPPRTGSEGNSTAVSSGGQRRGSSSASASASGSGGVSGRLSEWRDKIRSGSSSSQSGSGSISHGNMAGVGAGLQSRRSSDGPVRPPIPSNASAPPALVDGAQASGRPVDYKSRHSFSEGIRKPPIGASAAAEEQFAQIQRESIEAEERRRFQQLEDERLYRLALESSTAEEARRAQELSAARQREEEAFRQAMERSRSERERAEVEEQEALRIAMETSRKDKGKAVETEEQRREREELEMVMAMSLEETRRTRGAMTSAELFEQLSRPHRASLDDDDDSTRLSERQVGKAPERQDSYGGVSHALFSRPLVDASPEPEDRPLHHLGNASLHSLQSDISTQHEPKEDLPPPAYDFPAYAAENDAPDDVILGPGRPSEPSSSNSASYSQAGPARPQSNGHGEPSYRATTSFATLAPLPHDIRHESEPNRTFYSDAVTAALSPYQRQQSPSRYSPSSVSSISSSPHRRSDYFAHRQNSSARESFMSTVSVAGSFESERTIGSQDNWRGPSHSSPEIVVELDEDENEDRVADRDPFDDRYSVRSFEHSPERVRDGGDSQDGEASDMFEVMRRTGQMGLDGESDARYDERPIDVTLGSQLAHDQDAPTPQQPPALQIPAAPNEVTVVDSGSPSPVTTPTSLADTRNLSSTSGLTAHNNASMASLRTSPSFGGYVESTASNALADENVLSGVKWGFVSLARAGLRLPLEHEGDFPRGAQLSRQKDADTGNMDYAAFAVEARSWQSLLVFLMWHGNSRFEAAPSDLQAEKSGRGLAIAIVVEFYRSASTRQPRVRVRIELLPPDYKPDPNSAPAHLVSIPNSFDHESPSITIRLTSPPPPYLPIPLSALATVLSQAHAKSRHAPRPGWREATVMPSMQPTTPAQELSIAIDMFKSLNGERVVEDADEVEGHERSLLDRLKHRLKRRRAKGPKEIHSAPDERVGQLPDGANLITPFMLSEPTD